MFLLILTVKKSCFFFLLLIFTANAIAQNTIKNVKFAENTIYIFCRGTKTKSGLIAGKFNLKDRQITHVGIGFIEKKQLKIYNVIDCDSSKTALVIDDLKSFIGDEVFYVSIWKCKNNRQEFLTLKKTCLEYSSHKVYFDYSFDLSGKGNALYCSEFCSRVLRMTNAKKFNFHPQKMKLQSFYKAVLRREELLYYPVDFFQESDCFLKIFETNFNTEKL